MRAKAGLPGDDKSGKGKNDENPIEKDPLDRPGGIDFDGSALRECAGFQQNDNERYTPED